MSLAIALSRLRGRALLAVRLHDRRSGRGRDRVAAATPGRPRGRGVVTLILVYLLWLIDQRGRAAGLCASGVFFTVPFTSLMLAVTYVSSWRCRSAATRPSSNARIPTGRTRRWPDRVGRSRVVARPACRVGQVAHRCGSPGLEGVPAAFSRNSTTSGLVPVGRSDLGRDDPPARGDDEAWPGCRRSGRPAGATVACSTVIGQFLSLTNRRTVSTESSIETQTNSMFLPLSRGFAASRAIDGISPTQGPHQVAQMFRKTVLPLNRENDTGCSFRSSRVQS